MFRLTTRMSFYQALASLPLTQQQQWRWLRCWPLEFGFLATPTAYKADPCLNDGHTAFHPL